MKCNNHWNDSNNDNNNDNIIKNTNNITKYQDKIGLPLGPV